ncbi:Chromatin modification-related protein vid21 [Bienertia sinuspersici]
MGRIEWGTQGRGKWGCSYKRTTLIVCSINIVIALYVLRCLYSSVYLYSNNNSSQDNVKYTPDQLMRMEESIRIRKVSEPIELVKVVDSLSTALAEQKRMAKVPLHLKQLLRDEILQQLKTLPAKANATAQKEAVENWRQAKLHEAKLYIRGEDNVTLMISTDEAALLVEVMETKWSSLVEAIGLWIPPVIIHKEHDDKRPGIDELEEDFLPGRPVPSECNAQLHTDYDGVAVKWGLTHHRESAADCCQACFNQAKRANPGEMKCNTWVYCPLETGCYSPDIYEHKHQECWLKYVSVFQDSVYLAILSEKPKLNFKDKYSESYRSSHPEAPLVVPWVSGVVTA